MLVLGTDHLRQNRLDLPSPMGRDRLVGVAIGKQRLELLDGREGKRQLTRRLSIQRRPRLEPAGIGRLDPVRLRRRVGAGARARKNQASKRLETTSGVIQRENSTNSSSPASSIPASSASSRTAQALYPASSSPSSGSTAPPGNTHTPGMNLALSARFSSSTSSARSECFRPAATARQTQRARYRRLPEIGGLSRPALTVGHAGHLSRAGGAGRGPRTDPLPARRTRAPSAISLRQQDGAA